MQGLQITDVARAVNEYAENEAQLQRLRQIQQQFVKLPVSAPVTYAAAAAMATAAGISSATHTGVMQPQPLHEQPRSGCLGSSDDRRSVYW